MVFYLVSQQYAVFSHVIHLIKTLLPYFQWENIIKKSTTWRYWLYRNNCLNYDIKFLISIPVNHGNYFFLYKTTVKSIVSDIIIYIFYTNSVNCVKRYECQLKSQKFDFLLYIGTPLTAIRGDATPIPLTCILKVRIQCALYNVY